MSRLLVLGVVLILLRLSTSKSLKRGQGGVSDLLDLNSGLDFLEGDIPKTDFLEGDIPKTADGVMANAAGCTSGSCKWPKLDDVVRVPYTAKDFSKKEKRTIRAAMAEIQRNTCVRFKEIKERTKVSSFIEIISGTGCWSYVGSTGSKQQLSLQRNGCLFNGIILHELLHALGYFHEHSRTDRNDHVLIHLENVQPGRESNFYTYGTNNLQTPYDFDSVMQYSSFAFSSNNLPTITALDPSISGFGFADSLSENDILRINRLYQC